jgi:thiol-disulfide isomerase/thioredoxin
MLNNSNIMELTSKDFDIKKRKVKNTNGKSMIFFGVSWCGYCTSTIPAYASTSKMLGTSFDMFYLDCDKYPKIAEAFDIKSYPTIFFLKNGEFYKKYTSSRSTEGFLKEICKETMKCI